MFKFSHSFSKKKVLLKINLILQKMYRIGILIIDKIDFIIIS